MATDQIVQTISYPAGLDLSDKQYYMVKLDTDGQVILGTDGCAAIGVLYNDPAAENRVAQIACGGVIKVMAGAAISTTGVDCGCDQYGKLITASASGTPDKILCKNLDIATADGDIISVLWWPNGAAA